MGKRMIGEKYEVLEQLGQGGTACVYRVRDLRLGKVWAAKKLKKDSAADRGCGRAGGEPLSDHGLDRWGDIGKKDAEGRGV